MNNTLLGLTMLTTRSVYLKISTIMASSVSGAGWKVSCVSRQRNRCKDRDIPFPQGVCKDEPSNDDKYIESEREVGTHNAIHVEVQIVELDVVWIGSRDVDWNFDLKPVVSLHFSGLLLNDGSNCMESCACQFGTVLECKSRLTNLRILLAQPTKERRDTLYST
jgi:hypothetical protein